MQINAYTHGSYARLAGPDAARPIAPELARAGSAPSWAAGLALAAEILAAESRSASAGSPPSANAASTCARGRATHASMHASGGMLACLEVEKQVGLALRPWRVLVQHWLAYSCISVVHVRNKIKARGDPSKF